MAISFVETSARDNSSLLQNVGKVLKVLLLLLGLISSVVMLKGAFLPFSCEFVFSNVVGVWNSIKCVLSSPLYICIIINFMVLLIGALSASHRDDDPPPQPPHLDVANLEPPEPPPPQKHPQKSLPRTEKYPTPSLDHDHHLRFSDAKTAADELDGTGKEDGDDTMEAAWKALGGRKAKQLTKSKTFTQTGGLQHSDDQSPASSDFTWKGMKKSTTFNEPISIRRRGDDHQDDTMEATWKAITGGKAKQLNKSQTFTQTGGVQRPEDQTPASSTSKWKDMKKWETSAADQLDEDDTMEATWKAIISGGKAKELEKSETFIQTGGVQYSEDQTPASSAPTWKDLKKSETFNEAVSVRRRGGMIRRDPSVGIDEFNQQVEAFIKKFNDDMRLQRQESDQRFIDMIHRGGL